MTNKAAFRTSIGSWLIVLWGAGVCLFGLWRLSHWLVIGMSFVLLLLGIVLSVRRQQRLRRGYWVRYVHQDLLREDPGNFAVRYCEGPKEQYFYGVVGKRPHRDVLFVPSSEDWDSLVAAWVRGRRAEVLERLLADRIVARCDVQAANSRARGRMHLDVERGYY
jgi:hypothetical protein